jgi:hypothetical protein
MAPAVRIHHFRFGTWKVPGAWIVLHRVYKYSRSSILEVNTEGNCIFLHWNPGSVTTLRFWITFACRKISPSFVHSYTYTRCWPASRGTKREGKLRTRCLASPFLFPSSLPLLLRRSSISQIFCVQCNFQARPRSLSLLNVQGRKGKWQNGQRLKLSLHFSV